MMPPTHAMPLPRQDARALSGPVPARPPWVDLDRIAKRHFLQRRGVRRKQPLFHAGQPCRTLYLVQAGCFKTIILSEDGREKITGFHLRGDLLGVDSLDLPVYACDAVALDTSDVWELPVSILMDQYTGMLPQVTATLAAEVRREWHWMLALGTLGAEQRVAAFLLDFAARLAAMGYSGHHLLLRMTRADLGNYLALQLETVTRALTRLSVQGLIVVAGREIHIVDMAGLRHLLYR